jgi:hypothetical protein
MLAGGCALPHRTSFFCLASATTFFHVGGGSNLDLRIPRLPAKHGEGKFYFTLRDLNLNDHNRPYGRINSLQTSRRWTLPVWLGL